MKEKKLAAQLAGGEQKALGKIVDGFSAYVRTVAVNLSRGALTDEDIEEVMSDVFYKLWCSRDKLDPSLGLRPYLSAITRNTVKDRFKLTPPPAEDISELDIPLGLLVEEKAELDEMMRCLDEGLKRLSGEEREIFFRYYFYGERLTEISKAAGVSENAAHAKLSRTRGKLKKFLNERGFKYV